MNETVVQRVDRIEEALMKLAYAQFNNEMGLQTLREENLKFQREMAEFKNEMAEFKNEMAEFKNEMAEFKNEMAEFKNEMAEFKNEMLAFKDEMAEFKNEMAEFKNKVDADIEEMKRDRREMNRQWGALANKLGTIVEDIIYPSCRRIAREHFGAAEFEYEGQRIRVRRAPGEHREFDGIFVWAGHVLLLEAKATVRPEYLERFGDFLSRDEFFDYFPLYRGRRLIPVFSSLSLRDDEIGWLTARRIYAMAMGEDAMMLLNAPAIEGS